VNAPAIVNVSPSVLADVLTCETKAWSRHIKGYTSKGDAIKAVAGQGFHAAIAEHFRPDRAFSQSFANTMKAFHDVYDSAFARLPADALPDQAYLPANLHRVLARWIEMHPSSALPWRKVLTVEEAFTSRTFTVGDTTVKLIVRPDLVIEDFNGAIRFVDTKTTGWRISDSGWRRALRLSLQVALYTDAVAQRYPGRSVCGGWINAIEMRTLPSDPTRKCATHKLTYAECGNEHVKYEFIECMTTPERLAQALTDAESAAERFVRMLRLNEHELNGAMPWLNMNGGANGACRFCAAGNWCEAGRVPEALGSFMQYEPWVVEEGTR